MNVRRTIAVVSVLTCGLSACIIGPKQDDPADERMLQDAGVIFSDTSAGGGSDAPAVADTAAPPLDDDTGADATAPSDTGTADTGSFDTSVADTSGGDATDALIDASDASDAAEGG